MTSRIRHLGRHAGANECVTFRLGRREIVDILRRMSHIAIRPAPASIAKRALTRAGHSPQADRSNICPPRQSGRRHCTLPVGASHPTLLHRRVRVPPGPVVALESPGLSRRVVSAIATPGGQTKPLCHFCDCENRTMIRIRGRGDCSIRQTPVLSNCAHSPTSRALRRTHGSVDTGSADRSRPSHPTQAGSRPRHYS